MRLPFLELALTLLCALGSRPSTLRSLSSYYDSAAATSALYRIRNFAELEGPRRLETLCVCAPSSVSFSQGKDLYSKTRNGILATVILCPR